MLNIKDYLNQEDIFSVMDKYNVFNIKLHEKKVTYYTMNLFDLMKDKYNLSTEERNILEYSALLHDIGYFINREKHYKHTNYIILKEPLFNKLPEEILLLLAIISSSHGKWLNKNIYLYSNKLGILKLISLLRIGDALDYTHNLNIHLNNMKIKKNGNLSIKVTGFGSKYIVEKVKKKSDLFFNAYGIKVRIKSA